MGGADGPGIDLAGIAVREFRREDADALRALWTVAGFRLIADDDDGLATFLARNPGSFLVAEQRGRLVGSAMGGWDGRRGWIYHVTVAEDLRRLGLATVLVRQVEDALRRAGCRRCLVSVEGGNDAALAFWRRLGYADRGTSQLGKDLQAAGGG